VIVRDIVKKLQSTTVLIIFLYLEITKGFRDAAKEKNPSLQFALHISWDFSHNIG